jgi:hypothetical protein
MESQHARNFQERQIEIDGWPVKLTSYRVRDKYICQADNVSPGACLARFVAMTAEEAEDKALSKARYLLGKTQRRPV